MLVISRNYWQKLVSRRNRLSGKNNCDLKLTQLVMLLTVPYNKLIQLSHMATNIKEIMVDWLLLR
jgi:hypothetical protein